MGSAASLPLLGSSAHRPGCKLVRQLHNPEHPIRCCQCFFRRGESKFWHHRLGPIRGQPALSSVRSRCPLHWRQNCHFDPKRHSTAARRPPACYRLSLQSDGTLLPSAGRTTNGRLLTPGVANREPGCASHRSEFGTAAKSSGFPFHHLFPGLDPPPNLALRLPLSFHVSTAPFSAPDTLCSVFSLPPPQPWRPSMELRANLQSPALDSPAGPLSPSCPSTTLSVPRNSRPQPRQ